MKQNVTFSIGSIAVIDKIASQTDFFKFVFDNLAGRAMDFIPLVKLLIWNKLDESYSIDRLPDFVPEQMLDLLGFEGSLSSRTANRTLERLGERSQLILNKYQDWIEKQNLVDKNQLVDFTSTYFEGRKHSLAKKGYSRDDKRDKLQITLGIATGINGIPTMLTVSEGNEQDRKHMKKIIKLTIKVCEKGTLFIFDCGGNSKEIKEQIKKNSFNFLTLMAKHAKTYKKYIALFKEREKTKIIINENTYSCVKISEESEFKYIFFSEKLMNDQLEKKDRKFIRKLAEGEKIENKVRSGKDLEKIIFSDGWIVTKGIIQSSLEKMQNPFVSGIEGFFILESSVDAESEKILQLYKDRGMVENFMRDLKEGAQMRPIRHWSKNAVLGYILIIFLAKFIFNLTLLLTKNPLVRNLKLHKKYLMNLTLSIFYPKNYFKLAIISNFSAEMKALFGDYLKKFGSLELEIV